MADYKCQVFLLSGVYTGSLTYNSPDVSNTSSMGAYSPAPSSPEPGEHTPASGPGVKASELLASLCKSPTSPQEVGSLCALPNCRKGPCLSLLSLLMTGKPQPLTFRPSSGFQPRSWRVSSSPCIVQVGGKRWDAAHRQLTPEKVSQRFANLFAS